MSFCGEEWLIFGRISDARDDVCEDAEVVCSVRMVVWYAIQELCDKWSALAQEYSTDRLDILKERSAARGGRHGGAYDFISVAVDT